MSNWNGKIAWVTGASSGIGKAICVGLADAGAIVILSSRNQSQLEEVQKELKNSENQSAEINQSFEYIVREEEGDNEDKKQAILLQKVRLLLPVIAHQRSFWK